MPMINSLIVISACVYTHAHARVHALVHARPNALVHACVNARVHARVHARPNAHIDTVEVSPNTRQRQLGPS